MVQCNAGLAVLSAAVKLSEAAHDSRGCGCIMYNEHESNTAITTAGKREMPFGIPDCQFNYWP